MELTNLSNLRLVRDDYIPHLEYLGLGSKIKNWAKDNMPLEIMLWFVANWNTTYQSLTKLQFLQAMSDMAAAGLLEQVTVSGDSLPTAISRPSKLSGLAISGGNFTFNAPTSPYIVRVYVGGELKKVLTSTNTVTLADLGNPTAGSVIQCCQVTDGVVGWWKDKTVT